ncbi:MAG: Maf family protein [Bacteroidaceae bacterium]|nr:Maf family protein [Bacteroidaceae bacterium]
MKLILASNSPRRRQLLAGLDIPFEVRLIEGIDESCPDDIPFDEVPCYLSRLKAEAYVLDDPEEVLITADTVVAVEGMVLGKPHDAEEAKAMLRLLSGREHQVITGVTLRGALVKRALNSRESSVECRGAKEDSFRFGFRFRSDDMFTFMSSTTVFFADLSDEQIDYYVERYKPMDKAGAYGIQEWIGYVGVRRIEGSYYNVMGLPVQALSEYLRRIKEEEGTKN